MLQRSDRVTMSAQVERAAQFALPLAASWQRTPWQPVSQLTAARSRRRKAPRKPRDGFEVDRGLDAATSVVVARVADSCYRSETAAFDPKRTSPDATTSRTLLLFAA